MSRWWEKVTLNCPDCNAPIGSLHADGCDVERCPCCGLQAISCACADAPHNHQQKYAGLRFVWDGYWPWTKETIALGLWCYYDREAGAHGAWTPCEEGDPDATPDFNRLYREYEWDSSIRRWIKRKRRGRNPLATQ